MAGQEQKLPNLQRVRQFRKVSVAIIQEMRRKARREEIGKRGLE